MAWQVALVLDAETNLNVAIGQMPLWAQSTPERKAYPPEERASWNSMWFPDPGFTLITTPPIENLVEAVSALIPTMELHHPNLFCIHLFGVPKSEYLDKAMAEAGYYQAKMNLDPGLTFMRSIEKFERELILDASGWNLKSDWFWTQDLCSAFFSAVGAPEWHGRNFDALDDSIANGGINKIEVPYRIVICNAPSENEMVKGILTDFADFIQHMHARGCPVAFAVASE